MILETWSDVYAFAILAITVYGLGWVHGRDYDPEARHRRRAQRSNTHPSTQSRRHPQ